MRLLLLLFLLLSLLLLIGPTQLQPVTFYFQLHVFSVSGASCQCCSATRRPGVVSAALGSLSVFFDENIPRNCLVEGKDCSVQTVFMRI